MRALVLAAVLTLSAGAAHAYDAATAAALRDKALNDPTAWRLLESLTRPPRFGPGGLSTGGLGLKPWKRVRLRREGKTGHEG